ncbi:hypothetical protein DCO58_01225 [Helicobacter saguini]|uniref:Restriction endonuclease n=1 Tax=Helicobacter saguini TaxID=1548018 RepID=A0A347VR90_9HELI|nr:hypothetical protein [Helicobacter saguini]MWV62989.1 hypothetical protein [Helicobacter saguini]MWV66342.1 hypothetical protein [Helicobacter saguini]MWV68694.1 hypothetical protein [Helicobacter saguini]MWV71755.1 hypothetical protein [Helicobacter saguini]TLD91549.1 hypothetical protein LS64_011785 [Helicobacter saguini]
MQNFYDNLTNINPALKCLKFLYHRILRDDYRGTHKLQHYRWSSEYIKITLQNIAKFSDSKGFLYHTSGDINESYRYKENEIPFCEFINAVNFDLKKADSGSTKDMVMRKIIFVNLQRMGFIERYNNHKELCDVNKKYKNYRYVKLTQSGIDFIESNNLFKSQKILGLALDSIFDGLVQDIFDILSSFNEKQKYLSIEEMTYFVTYLNKSYENKILNKDDIIEFISEFRSLGARQKIVTQVINDFCNPKNFKGNKTQKRDLHNWKNEAQSIFDSLNLMSLFEYDSKTKRLFLKDSINNEKIIFKRSNIIKEQYFKNHNVQKDSIFELHHIVPFYFAKDIDSLKIIDNWQNLIYIDANSHKRLTHKSGRNAIRLSFKDKNAILDDFLGVEICLEFERNVKYNINLQNIMREYNQKLL